MLQGRVRDVLSELSGGGTILSRVLRVVGIGEAAVEERIRDLMQGVNPTLAPYAKPAEVHLRLTAAANSAEEAKQMLDPIESEIRVALGQAVYGIDEETLEFAVIEALKRANKTLAVAESCTGGGLGSRLTSVPGSSAVFWGGVIAYANSLKQRLLGVPADLLAEHGAVSEACARAMAEGARNSAGTDYALSITGIAGPDGGTDEKPVGLVFLGLAGPNGTEVVKAHYRGSREDIRIRASTQALNLLRMEIYTQK